MEQKKKYKIVIIEPSTIICAGIKSLLTPYPEFEINHVFADLTHFIERVSITPADIVLLNPSLLDYQKRMSIKSLLPTVPGTLLFALLYGYAEAEVLKQYNGTIEITDDAATITRKLKQAIESNQDNADTADSYELSEREKEILTSVARGMTNKEIADVHNISIHTVISHRKNISRKTGIKTVSGLTVYALLNNLIDQSDIE